MTKVDAKKLKIVIDMVKDIRAAVADYMYSEGCSCCQSESHEDNAKKLAELLGVENYIDEDVPNFYKYSPIFIKQDKEDKEITRIWQKAQTKN